MVDVGEQPGQTLAEDKHSETKPAKPIGRVSRRGAKITFAEVPDRMDLATVKAYTQDLRGLLEEAGFTERKAFLRSFIRRIQGIDNYIIVYCNCIVVFERKWEKGGDKWLSKGQLGATPRWRACLP